MATVNETIGLEWEKIADPTEDFLITVRRVAIELAVTNTETPPTIDFGHHVSQYKGNAGMRSVIGPGYVYARVFPGSRVDEAETAISRWAL
jgi:hypothetical protein